MAVLLLCIVAAAVPASDLLFNGFVRNYTGVRMTGTPDFAVVENTFDMTMEYSSNGAALLVNPTMKHSADNSLNVDMRQAYLDIYLPNIDFRVGLQQITWGKADGVFITDVVSPKNLQEFLLPDFNEIRMGITAIRGEYFLGNSSIELIWVPLFSPNTLPETGSIWSVSPIDFSDSGSAVEKSLSNSEIFGRYSLFSSAIDLEIMAGYTWDDEPTPHLVSPPPSPAYALDHHRITLFGGSFGSTIGGFVLRGEGAYYSGKYFQSKDSALSDGTIRKDYLHYMGGIDYRQSGWSLSTQFIQKFILDYDKEMVSDELDTMMTFLVSRNFLGDILRAELFVYTGLNSSDALIRPTITYAVTDDLALVLGGNIFAGEEGTFGQYNDNDMIYAKLKMSF
jgi:hypothetical protein